MGRKTRKKQEVTALAEKRVADRLSQKKNSGKVKRGVVTSQTVMTSEMRARRSCWLRKPNDWIFRGKSKRADKHRLALVRHLFGKYAVPSFLDRVWDKPEGGVRMVPGGMRENDFIDWYVAVAQGKSLYKLHSRKFLSKKETHQFLQAPARYTCNQAMWWAKAVCEGADIGHANRIVNSAFGHRFGTRVMKDEFWLSVLRFFVHNPIELNEINDLLDYLVTEHRDNEHFKMKGRSLESVRRRSEEWHRALYKKQQIGGGTWTGIDVPNWSATSGKKHERITWTVKQILTGNDLYKEGQAMRHCVVAYKSRCVDGATGIFSLTSQSPILPIKRQLTIEVRAVRSMVVQVRGFANRMATNQERNILRQWAHSSGFRLASQI